MGLTKQYLRYEPSAVFGLIGSQKANVVFVRLRGGEQGRYVAAGACEHVFIWDVRKAEKVLIKTSSVWDKLTSTHIVPCFFHLKASHNNTPENKTCRKFMI